MADENYRRKLTAILCADVAGYSRLIDKDEADTVSTLKSQRTFYNIFITPLPNLIFKGGNNADSIN